MVRAAVVVRFMKYAAGKAAVMAAMATVVMMIIATLSS